MTIISVVAVLKEVLPFDSPPISTLLGYFFAKGLQLDLKRTYENNYDALAEKLWVQARVERKFLSGFDHCFCRPMDFL